MSALHNTYDVFITHSSSDAPLAAQIAEACRANGLSAITGSEVLAGTDPSDALWEAVAESRALLAILSPTGPTSSMAIELGAARAWNKPIFGITTNPAMQAPSGLTSLKLYPASRTDEVIRAIRLAMQESSDADRLELVKLYGQLGTSVDQLALEPRQLAELVRRFTSRTNKSVPGERLLSELLRLRKQGKLSKSQAKDRSKAQRGTA